MCTWEKLNEPDEHNWETSCGHGFAFGGDDTSPTDAGWAMCPYCGGTIGEELWDDVNTEEWE